MRVFPLSSAVDEKFEADEKSTGLVTSLNFLTQPRKIDVGNTSHQQTKKQKTSKVHFVTVEHALDKRLIDTQQKNVGGNRTFCENSIGEMMIL
eukprot:TRINITY_DN17123_c0_g1_i1.p2 TRINITY_DN17123_c0_g1~~TRINITY_DN17123_c0_g1_i1.p2  ORF type:complete len:93 (+),score=13.19 TRINITY_DN17123_c0_g1_i1:93-371(+)